MSKVVCLFWAAMICGGAIAAVPRAAIAQEAEGEKVAGDGGEKGSAAPAETEHFIIWAIKTSGWIGLGILLLSIYFIATLIRLFIELRMEVAVPSEVVGRCEELIKQRDFKQVYDFTREHESFVARVLSVGIAELPNGLVDAREAMDRASEAETVEMEKKISMLAVLGTLGPMIGLLGTLSGMISSFGVIARTEGASIKANEVARGISEALLLTWEGVFLSVPAIFFFAFFRNRVSSISVAAQMQADQLLRHFSHSARAKPGAAQPVVAAVPARPAKPG